MIEEIEQEKPIQKYEYLSEISDSEDLMSLNHLVFLKTQFIQKMVSINEMVHIVILPYFSEEENQDESDLKQKILTFFCGSFGLKQNRINFMNSKQFLEKESYIITSKRSYTLIIICLDEECRRDQSFEEKLPKNKEIFFPMVNAKSKIEPTFMELINDKNESYHEKMQKFDNSNNLFLDESNNIKDIFTYKLSIQTIKNKNPISKIFKQKMYQKLFELISKFSMFNFFSTEINQYLKIDQNNIRQKHQKIINIYTKQLMYGLMDHFLKDKPNIYIITYFFPIIQDIHDALNFFSEQRKKQQLRTGKYPQFNKQSNQSFQKFKEYKYKQFPTDLHEIYDFKKNNENYIFVYKVCHSRKQTINMFMSKIGKGIESIGFLSTSSTRSISDIFPMRNTLFIIKIPKNPLSQKYSNNYADISSMSVKKQEQEVLFNLMSLFYVEKVQVLYKNTVENKDCYDKYKVYLVYGEKLVNGKRQGFSQIIQPLSFISSWQKPLADIGDSNQNTSQSFNLFANDLDHLKLI